MIWFYSRDDQRIRLEMRYDNDTGEFLVVISHPDGRHETERFADLSGFSKSVVALEQLLKDEHWSQSGPPLLVPEGFPNRRLTPALVPGILAGSKTMANRTYATEMRFFEITLSGTPALNHSSWIVETVRAIDNRGAEITIPTMEEVVASTEDEAYARACDRIDKWLRSTR